MSLYIVILDSKLMTSVTPEMFAEGEKVAQEALKGSFSRDLFYTFPLSIPPPGAQMPPSALKPKSLAAGASTILYAALDPSLEGRSSHHESILKSSKSSTADCSMSIC